MDVRFGPLRKLNGSFEASISKISLEKKKRSLWHMEELMLLIVVLEKTLESPLGCKEIKPVNPEGNQF